MNNDFYSQNDFRLYHHGVLGQKKGVRKGPPYPLKPEQHSASEKKAGWQKSLSSNRRVVGSYGVYEDASPKPDKAYRNSSSSSTSKTEKPKKGLFKKLFGKKEESSPKNVVEKSKEKINDAEETAKKAIINSGDQRAIYEAAHSGRLTTKEFEEAVKKCELDQRLRNTMPKQETVNKMRDASAKLKDFSDLARNGIDLYNNLADVVNSFSPNTQMIKLDGSALRRFRDEQAAQARASEKAEQDRLWKVARSGDKDAIKADIDNMSSAQLQEANKHNSERAKFDKYVSDMDAKAKATKMSEADNDGRFDLASMLSKAQESEKDRKRQSTIRGDF